MVYGGAINSLMGFTNRKGQQEGYRMNGANFGTSELICPTDTIINGFHFPYPLNGTTEGMHRE